MLDGVVSCALKRLWKMKVPSKIWIFGGRLVLNRIPTRLNLETCGILVGQHNLVCPLYFGESEDVEHLFPISVGWWKNSCGWLQVDMPLSLISIIEHLQVFESSIKCRMKVDSGWIFGLAICWTIWVCGNAILFYGGLLNKFEVLGMMKLLL